MKKYIVALILLCSLNACKQSRQPQAQEATADAQVADSVVVVNDPKSNLNIQTNRFTEIDSSGVFMFPLSMAESGSRGSSSYKDMPNSFWNIIFYNGKTGTYHLLTEKKIAISSYNTKSSAYDDANATPVGKYIFYAGITDDINQDKKLNSNDPQYLFVSDKEGNNFRQVSPPGYDLQSWEYVQSLNKIMLTAIKDSDGDREFEDSDEVVVFEADIDNGQPAKEIFSQAFKNKLKLLFDKDWKRDK